MKAYRYVNDHGELFRMTEARYRSYLLDGTRADKFPDAAEFGKCIGSVLTVIVPPTDFQDVYNREANLKDKG